MVTQCAMLLAAASLVRTAFPNADVGFALLRTLPPGEVGERVDPSWVGLR